jgi:hypothetical protein
MLLSRMVNKSTTLGSFAHGVRYRGSFSVNVVPFAAELVTDTVPPGPSATPFTCRA